MASCSSASLRFRFRFWCRCGYRSNFDCHKWCGNIRRLSTMNAKYCSNNQATHCGSHLNLPHGWRFDLILCACVCVRGVAMGMGNGGLELNCHCGMRGICLGKAVLENCKSTDRQALNEKWNCVWQLRVKRLIYGFLRGKNDQKKDWMVFDRVGIQFKGYSMANKQSSGLYSGIFPFNYNRASRDHFLCVSNKIDLTTWKWESYCLQVIIYEKLLCSLLLLMFKINTILDMISLNATL